MAERPSEGGRLPTTLILLASVAVGLAASVPGSPFTPPLYEGAGAPAWLSTPASWLGLEAMPRGVLAVVGGAFMFAAVFAFLFALRAAWRGELTVRRVVVVALVLHALAVAVPLFLSRDAYSYASYGRMVSHHSANPYVTIPASFPDDPTYSLVSVDWIDSTSVYGPAFVALSAGVTALFSSPAAMVLAFKLVAAAASIGTLLLVIASSRRVMPRRAAFAAVLIGWNPVVVFHGVGGGHNDALLGLAIAAGVLAILRGRGLLGTAGLAFGALVKISGGVPLAIAAAGAAARRPPGARLGTVARHLAVAAAVALPFVLPFMQTDDPTLGTLELTSRQGWLAPSRFVLVTLRGAARALGGETAADVVSILVRVAFPLVFLWALVLLVRHLARDPARTTPTTVVAAMAWAGLISLLISPVLLPWYIAWVLPLAWILPTPARGGAVLLSATLAMTELVAEPSRSPGVYEAMVFGLHWIATPLMVLVLIRVLLDLRRRVRLPRDGPIDPLLAEDLPVGWAEQQEIPGRGERADQNQGARTARA